MCVCKGLWVFVHLCVYALKCVCVLKCVLVCFCALFLLRSFTISVCGSADVRVADCVSVACGGPTFVCTIVSLSTKQCCLSLQHTCVRLPEGVFSSAAPSVAPRQVCGCSQRYWAHSVISALGGSCPRPRGPCQSPHGAAGLHPNWVGSR